MDTEGSEKASSPTERPSSTPRPASGSQGAASPSNQPVEDTQGAQKIIFKNTFIISMVNWESVM